MGRVGGEDAVTYMLPNFAFPGDSPTRAKIHHSLLTLTIHTLCFPLLPVRRKIPDTKKDKKDPGLFFLLLFLSSFCVMILSYK